MASTQVERYLASIEARLHHLPPAQRDEELLELRQHLESLIEDNWARGMADDDAAAAALRQFDEQGSLGMQLQQSTRPLQARRLWPLLTFYLCSATIIFVLLRTANDKPTDFPSTITTQLLFALLLPLGTLAAGFFFQFGAQRFKTGR